MAKAQQLPSGSWRVRIRDYDDPAQPWKSFTADTAKEAELKALEYQLFHKERKKPANMTVGEAIDSYIDGRTNVLSPSTIAGYRCLRRNAYKSIEAKRLASLKSPDIQAAINSYAKDHTPKSVANAFALISAALAEHYPDLKINVNLPQKQKHEIEIPTTEEVNSLCEKLAGTPLYLPVLLAALCGLRRSEICALTWNDIDVEHRRIHVRSAVVLDEYHTLVKSGTKTYDSNRTLPLPEQVIMALPEKGEEIITLTPNQISDSFSRFVRKNFPRYFSFHALRHYHASVLLQLNVPDKYAMEMMGHSTNNMLKTVYQHTFSTEQAAITERVQNFFAQQIRMKEDNE